MTISAQTAAPDQLSLVSAASSPILWITAAAVLAIIAVQSIIYTVAARRAAPSAGMTETDVRTAYRAGAVSSIGPSLAVALIAITLLSVFGTPAVLIRIGLIGSAPYEVAAAEMVAANEGTSLGGAGFDDRVFATALLSMGIAGAMWMVVTLIVTPLMKRGTLRATSGGGRGAALMGTIASAALVSAFMTFALREASAGLDPLLIALSSAATMGLCLLLARLLGKRWITEWGLGAAIVVGLVLAHQLG